MVTAVASAAGLPVAGSTSTTTESAGNSTYQQQATPNGQSVDTRAIKNGIYTAYAPNIPYSLRRAPALDLNTVERRGTSFVAKEVKRSRPSGIQEAPTYRPTEEEFKEPFQYISKIRAEAEQYGICKIIPPDSWVPNFAVDTERFFFKTRRQELNSVEGSNRTNVQYLDQLAKYHKQHGMNLNRFPSVDKRPLDLYKLKKAVECRGGFDKVCKHKKWAEIGRDLGYSGKIMSSLSTSLKNSYQKWLHPYEEFVKANKAGPQQQQQQDFENSSPYTPASMKKQSNGSHQGTPIHMDNHSPAINASHSLNASLNGNVNPTDQKMRLPEASAPALSAPASSGFTPVNPGGFTPVNANPTLFASGQNNTTPDQDASNGFHKPFPGSGNNGHFGKTGTNDSPAPYQNGHSSNPNSLKRPWDQDHKATPSFKEGTISFDINNLDEHKDKKVKKAPNVLGSHMSQPRPVTQRTYSNQQNGKKGEVCDVCGLKDEKTSFIICYGCECGYHKGCLDPPARLSDARADWHCPKCLIGTGDFGFEEGGHYSLKQFQDKARMFKDHHFEPKMQYDPILNKKKAVTEDDVEREFWRIVESPSEEVEVEYGADIHSTTAGSGFPSIEKNPGDPYSTDPWNLNVLPYHSDSLFKHINTDISGMTIPWLYVGMCFSTFCWHNEDHYCYSANYQHFGATKTWYGIPGKDADAFETAMREAVPELFAAQPDLLTQLVTLLPPERLKKAGVNVYAADQRAGQFVITFPQAYHAGFNHGFNFNEAVNFAPADWEPFGDSSIRRLREQRKSACFSHDELLSTAAKRDTSIKTAKWLAPALQRSAEHELGLREEFLNQHKEKSGPHKCNIDKSSDIEHTCNLELEIKDIELPESEYQCEFCKAYTYFSSFHCTASGKVMCLSHAGNSPCCGADETQRYQGEQHVMRYRFGDDALRELVQKVVDRANLPEAWQERLSKALDEEEKPSLKNLQTLVNEGEKIPWELSGLADLKAFVAKCNEWVDEAQNYITRKQQNRRKNDRAWRKSKSAKVDDTDEKEKEARKVDNIFRLLSLADELSFDCPQITTLQERSDAIAEFQKDARTALANPSAPSTQDLEDLAESGKGFNVDIPEVDRLEVLVKQHRWIDEVTERTRVGGTQFKTLKEVKAKLEKGVEIGMSRETDLNMLRLKDLVHNGGMLEDKAAELMSADVVHHGQLEAIASQADRLPLSEETRNKMDGILSKQREAQKAIESFVRRSLDPDFQKRPKYKEARDAMDGFTDLTTKPQGAADLENAVKRQENWMRKGKKLFGKANAPLHILQQHLDYVNDHNNFCFDLTDRPRMPVEPASRQNSPVDGDEGDEGVKSEKNVFCMCRQPESGTMLECELCLEWSVASHECFM